VRVLVNNAGGAFGLDPVGRPMAVATMYEVFGTVG
jgi:hypothetical protein